MVHPPRRANTAWALLFSAAFLSTTGPAHASEVKPGEEPHLSSSGHSAARPHLVVDYLPALVYENELVPVRLRVVNPGETALECTVTLSLHAGPSETSPASSPEPVTLAVEAGRDAQVSFDVPPVGWATASVEFAPAGGEAETFWMAHFGEDEGLPRLVARGEHLYVAETGDVAVLSLRQRTSQPDRQWYLWKRLASSLGEGALPARVMVLGARLSPPVGETPRSAHGESTSVSAGAGSRPSTAGGRSVSQGASELPPYLAEVVGDSPVRVAAYALPGESDRRAFAPVLADVAAALAAFEREPPAELVVWVVACDDARRATPLWTYRKAADLLLLRARAWGAARLVVMFVPEPAVPSARRSLYADELRRSATAYRGDFVRLGELAEARCWAAEGPEGPSRALGRYPNARGHGALARAVLERIRP